MLSITHLGLILFLYDFLSVCTHYLGNRKIVKISKRSQVARVCESLRPSSHMVLDLGAPRREQGTRGPGRTPVAAGRRHQDSENHAVEKPGGGEAAKGASETNRASEASIVPASVGGGKELILDSTFQSHPSPPSNG